MTLLSLKRAGVLLGTALLLLSGLSATPANAVSEYGHVFNGYTDVTKSLDAWSGNGAPVQLRVHHGRVDQQWRNYGQDRAIQHGFSGKCLDADTSQGSREGMKVQLWGCHGGANQKWHIWPDGAITSRYNGMCLDADISRGNVDGMKVQLWTCHGGANQRWSRGAAVPWDTSYA